MNDIWLWQQGVTEWLKLRCQVTQRDVCVPICLGEITTLNRAYVNCVKLCLLILAANILRAFSHMGPIPRNSIDAGAWAMTTTRGFHYQSRGKDSLCFWRAYCVSFPLGSISSTLGMDVPGIELIWPIHVHLFPVSVEICAATFARKRNQL